MIFFKPNKMLARAFNIASVAVDVALPRGAIKLEMKQIKKVTEWTWECLRSFNSPSWNQFGRKRASTIRLRAVSRLRPADISGWIQRRWKLSGWAWDSVKR